MESGGRRRAMLAAAAGLVLAVASAVSLVAMDARIGGLQNAVSRRAADLAGGARIPKGQEVLVARRSLSDRAAGVAPITSYLSAAPARLLAGLLEAAAQGDITFDNLALGRTELVLSGDAGTWEACESLAGEVKRSGWTPVVERTGDPEAKRVGFSLKAMP